MITIGRDALAPENRAELFATLREAGVLVTPQEASDQIGDLRVAARGDADRDLEADQDREGPLREGLAGGLFLWVP